MTNSDNQIKGQSFELAKVALGEAEADLAIVNGNIVNVYTGEVVAGETVLVKGERIAYIGKNAQKAIGAGTKVIDATGKTLIPGFIDGHTHVDHVHCISEFIRYAMKGGTTTVISETSEIAFRLGYRGIMEFLKSVKNQPIKFWVTLPAMVTISPTAEEHALTMNEVRRLLQKKEVVGLGETYWAPVVAGHPRVQQVIAEVMRSGKKAEGHTAGASGNKLQAYDTLGFSSDHESTSTEEALERLRLGMFTMIREGETRRELEAISRIKDANIDFRLLGLASDGMGPWQLTTDGYLEFVVQKAINLGFPPIRAIQMATINVAQHFHLEDSIGGIAPGKYADIIIIPNLTTIRAEYVISNGKIVAQNGEPIVPTRRHIYPKAMQNSIRLDRTFSASDFTVSISGDRQQVKVRAIDQVTNLVTKEAIVEMAVSERHVLMDTTRDIVKIAAIERVHVPGKTFTGFIRGMGLKRGAIATSTPWDATDIIVIGASEADMALAVNRLSQLHGGIVACHDSNVLAEVPLPVGGIASLEPTEILGQQLHQFQQTAASMGCVWPDMRTTLSPLTSGAIPYIRICEHGLFNLRLNSFVDLLVD